MQQNQVRSLVYSLQRNIRQVIVGKDEDAFLLSNKLRKMGVFVPPAVFPAVPKGRALLRYCVTSCHHEEQIVEALDKLEECAKACGIELPRTE